MVTAKVYDAHKGQPTQPWPWSGRFDGSINSAADIRRYLQGVERQIQDAASDYAPGLVEYFVRWTDEDGDVLHEEAGSVEI